MQSFLTVFIAGILAFMGVFMMNPEPDPQIDVFAEVDAFAETVSMDLVAELPTIPSIVIEQDVPLVLALDAYHQFYDGMDIPTDAWLSFEE